MVVVNGGCGGGGWDDGGRSLGDFDEGCGGGCGFGFVEFGPKSFKLSIFHTKQYPN